MGFEHSNASETGTQDSARSICMEALETWGPDAQTLMVFEEMSELQKALCKYARAHGAPEKAAIRDEIADEIADVEIMLAQMKLLHDCETDVEIHRQMKLNRLKERLNKARDTETQPE